MNSLAEETFCLLLNPRLTELSAFSANFSKNWLALYRVEKTLTDSNYVEKNWNELYTIVQRFRVHSIKPQYEVTDIEDSTSEFYSMDPILNHYRGEQDLVDNGCASFLDNDRMVLAKKL